MSYIGNSPGVSSQRVVTEEVISGSPKSAFYPVGGYALGYVDVLINGLEVDSSDFTATDGVVVTLGTAAAVGDTVKIKAYIPRGLSDGYLKSEADALLANKFDKAGGQITGGVGIGGAAEAGSQLRTYNGAGHGKITIETTDAYAAFVNYSGASSEASAGFVKSDNSFRFNQAGDLSTAERMRLDMNNGNLSPTGNLVLASGKGIDFSANSNAGGMTGEVLDDYEVGTWTPSPVCTYGSITYSAVSGTGTYVKIGKTVYCWFKVNFTASSNSGNTGMSGLPFAISTAGLSGGLQMAGTAREDSSSGNLYQVEGFTNGNSYFQVLRRYDNGSIISGANAFGGSFMYQTT